MTLEKISENRCFGGTQTVWSHDSEATGTPMRFAVFLPPQADQGPVPALVFLSGLTCTEQNATTKGGFQRVAAELGLALVFPDTSPRGEGVPDVEAWDFGQGAGFYLDATESPWAEHFQMERYVIDELHQVLAGFPIDRGRLGLTGHSMGGHGALVLAMKHPDRFRSLSAFAPIASATRCPWGTKALSGYLGEDRGQWAEHDASLLLGSRGWTGPILVDQGGADGFKAEQLKPELLAEAADAAGVDLRLRVHPGYDHSYYFVSTFAEEHLRFHAGELGM